MTATKLIKGKRNYPNKLMGNKKQTKTLKAKLEVGETKN